MRLRPDWSLRIGHEIVIPLPNKGIKTSSVVLQAQAGGESGRADIEVGGAVESFESGHIA